MARRLRHQGVAGGVVLAVAQVLATELNPPGSDRPIQRRVDAGERGLPLTIVGHRDLLAWNTPKPSDQAAASVWLIQTLAVTRGTLASRAPTGTPGSTLHATFTSA